MGTFEGIRVGVEADYEGAVRALFPTNDKFKMLQMLTDTNNKSQMPLTVLGILRRKYRSPFLKILQEEHNLNKIALDRKGRGDFVEIVGHSRQQTTPEE